MVKSVKTEVKTVKRIIVNSTVSKSFEGHLQLHISSNMITSGPEAFPMANKDSKPST